MVSMLRASILCVGIGLALGSWCSGRLAVAEAGRFVGLPAKEISSFEGIVYSDSVKSSAGGSIHYLKLASVDSRDARADAAGKILLFDASGRLYDRGERLAVRGELRIGTPPQIGFVGYTEEIVRRGFSSRFFRWRSSVRRKLDERMEMLGYPASALFRALFLGIREDIPENLAAAFEKTGTLHILALSGLHVGIISLLIFSVLAPLASRWLKWAVVIGTLLVYLLLVGPKSSLTRAFLFLLLYGLSRLLDRDWRPLNILAITLAISLFIDPAGAFNLSFQLSFLAMAGVLTLGRAFIFLLKPYLPRFLGSPLSCSLGAQAMVLPLSLSTFGVFYPIGIIATVAVLPLVTVFLWLGVLFLMILLSPTALPAAPYLGVVFKLIYDAVNAVLGFLQRAPGLRGGLIVRIWIASACAALAVYVFLRLRGRRRWLESITT